MNFYTKYILPKYLDGVMDRGEMKITRSHVVADAEGVVLEVGFGSGLNLPYYKNVTQLYALDPSQELFNLAQERISKCNFPITYIQASAEQIPLVDNSIDSVISSWSLCSIPNPQKALREIFRVLRPGGIFSFVEHGKSSNRFVSSLQKIFTPFSKIVSGGCHLDREIDVLIRDAGFDISVIEKSAKKYKPLAYMYQGNAVAKK